MKKEKQPKEQEQEWCICKKNPCNDKDCDCPLHYATKEEWLESKKQPKEESWEREFDERIDDLTESIQMENMGNKSYEECREEAVKRFITQLIAKERERFAGELSEKIKNIKEAVQVIQGTHKYDSCYDDCLDLINKLKK